MQEISDILTQIIASYAFIGLILIMLIWLFIRSAVASGTEEGTKRAIESTLKEFEFREDSDGKTYIVPCSTKYYYIRNNQAQDFTPTKQEDR